MFYSQTRVRRMIHACNLQDLGHRHGLTLLKRSFLTQTVKPPRPPNLGNRLFPRGKLALAKHDGLR